jgi:nucleoside 2-deoxyribosyltransferase
VCYSGKCKYEDHMGNCLLPSGSACKKEDNMKRVYIAGPDVFRDNAEEYLNDLKHLCSDYDCIGLSPEDVKIDYDGIPFSKEHGQLLFRALLAQIDSADIIVGNIIPFRGACIDDGTAGEMLYGFAKKKIIYGYTRLFNYTLKDITDIFAHNVENGEFPVVENFGENKVNLMIQEAIEQSGGSIFESFEDCLKDIKTKYNG